MKNTHTTLYPLGMLLLSTAVCAVMFIYAWHVRCTHVELRREMCVLRQVLDDAPIGIATADLDTNMTTYRNPALISMSGWTTTALNAKGGPRAHYVDPTQWDKLVRTIKDKSVFSEDVVIKRADGTPLEVHLLAIPTRQDHNVLLGFFTVRGDAKNESIMGHGGSKAATGPPPVQDR